MQQEMLPLFTSVDLFAGCGGLTRGLEDSGFRCLAFNEINKDAADSFALNFPDAIRLDGDIREAVSTEIIEKEILPIAGESGKLHIKAFWFFGQHRSLQKFLVVIFVMES